MALGFRDFVFGGQGSCFSFALRPGEILHQAQAVFFGPLSDVESLYTDKASTGTRATKHPVAEIIEGLSSEGPTSKPSSRNLGMQALYRKLACQLNPA